MEWNLWHFPHINTHPNPLSLTLSSHFLMTSSCLRSSFLSVFLLAQLLNCTDWPEHHFSLNLRDFWTLDNCTCCCVTDIVVVAKRCCGRISIVVGTRGKTSVRVSNIIVVQIALAITMTILWHLYFNFSFTFDESSLDDRCTHRYTRSVRVLKWNETPQTAKQVDPIFVVVFLRLSRLFHFFLSRKNSSPFFFCQIFFTAKISFNIFFY